MSRPHEDLQRRLLIDHCVGGEPIAFTHDAWIVIEIGHVKSKRVDAALSAYETMLERWRTSSQERRLSAVLSAANARSVVVLCEVGGHDEFRLMASAWDDHHRLADGRALVESRSLALYRVAECFGEMSIDPASRDAYIFERVYPQSADPAVGPRITEASGFEAAVVFRSDEANRHAILYRFNNFELFSAVRNERPSNTEHVHVDKTFSQSLR